jgi:hypothetical protein
MGWSNSAESRWWSAVPRAYTLMARARHCSAAAFARPRDRATKATITPTMIRPISNQTHGEIPEPGVGRGRTRGDRARALAVASVVSTLDGLVSMVVGGVVVGASVEGASDVGASVVGASVVGASVVGASVVGASVVGASVVGASDDGVSVGGSVVLVGSVIEGVGRLVRFDRMLSIASPPWPFPQATAVRATTVPARISIAARRGPGGLDCRANKLNAPGRMVRAIGPLPGRPPLRIVVQSTGVFGPPGGDRPPPSHGVHVRSLVSGDGHRAGFGD